MPRTKRETLRYQGTYPPHLATASELAALGFKPSREQPVIGIVFIRTPDRESMSALYEKALAIPLEQRPGAPALPPL